MVTNILVPHTLLIRSLLDLFSRCRVYHRTTLLFFAITLINSYVVSLLNVETEFT